MQENKDRAIKLFGKKIPLQGEGQDPAISDDSAIDVEQGGGDDGGQKKLQEKDEADKESQIGKVTKSPEEKEADEQFPQTSVNPEAPLMEEGTAKSSKNDDGTNSQEKSLKNPDQVLPCPRCDSMKTKFCYYNNYNIKQPRHFCKSCQRYWTAGGTMRNVPVGAGRRKTKNNSSRYRFVTINDALRVARISAPNETNGKVLSFGSDPPIGSVQNLADNKIVSESIRNGFHNQISYLPGISWPVPSGFPSLSSKHPAAFWNANIPRFSTNSSSPTLKWLSCGPNFRVLGKHTRDGDMPEKEEQRKQRDGSVLVSKTLRIDDPSEAAKSSIWTTLGMKKESLNGGSMFEAFQWRKDGKNQKHVGVETSSVLTANPAALSRSVYFHENT